MSPPEKNNAMANPPVLAAAFFHLVWGIARWLIEFFKLTEADLVEAGIYVGSKR